MAEAVTYRTMLDPGFGASSSFRGSQHFPSPFLDMASLSMPDNRANALKWCEYIFSSNGTYRQAMERIIAYFLTDHEVGAVAGESLGDDEKEKWQSCMGDDLNVLGFEQELDRDCICYGNAFASVIVPFRRHIACPRCGLMVPLKVAKENNAFKFEFSNYEFHAQCPKCKFSGVWRVKDEAQSSSDKLLLKRWSPHDIHILHDTFTDQAQYLWKIPEEYKKQLREGKLYHLERVDMGVLKAVKTNHLFRFAPDVIYHMKEPTLGGVMNRGWGISRIITNFRQIWYCQVLHRYNEAIALDYVIPFRLITPMARSGSGAAGGQVNDPLLMTNMGDFMSQVRRMVKGRARDPAGWHTLPFPVQYQALGGEATQLAPRELLDQGMETLLNAAGTPVELYKGTMQLQTAPVSLRLFEATWHHQVHSNNRFLRWLVGRISDILTWEKVSVRHKRVTHADDMQRHMALLQLMMGGTISQTTGLRALGLDFKDELRLLSEESRKQQEVQSEVQEEMDQAAYGQQVAAGQPPQGQPGQPMQPGGGGGGASGGGAPPGGAAPGAPAGPVTSMVQNNTMPQTPQEMLEAAQSIAQQLLGLPEAQKDSELHALKEKNEVLHSLVVAALDKIRNKAKSQGGAQLMQQTYGSG